MPVRPNLPSSTMASLTGLDLLYAALVSPTNALALAGATAGLSTLLASA